VNTRILASSSPGEVRTAVEHDDRLVDYAIWRPGAPDGVGDLHRGRVTGRVPAMGGVFVALGGMEGFLPDSEGGKEVTEGAILPVRISRAAQGGKGPRLTARLPPGEQALAEAGPPGLLRRGPGAVERLAAQYPVAPIVVDDMAVMAALRPALGERLGFTARPFDEQIEGQIAELEQPVFVLPGGARMSVYPTPALVAIDIDAGSALSQGGAKTSAHMDVNKQILPALARQIRLRNLSGAILVDLAGLPPRRRLRLGPAIAAALAGDPLQPRFMGFTSLGLAEIVRRRVHPPLYELLTGPHAAGLAALRAIAGAHAAMPARMPALRASPAVVGALERDPVALPEVAHRTGHHLMMHSDPSLRDTEWRMEAANG
jgi:Ribonuclease G/E